MKTSPTGTIPIFLLRVFSLQQLDFLHPWSWDRLHRYLTSWTGRRWFQDHSTNNKFVNDLENHWKTCTSPPTSTSGIFTKLLQSLVGPLLRLVDWDWSCKSGEWHTQTHRGWVRGRYGQPGHLVSLRYGQPLYTQKRGLKASLVSQTKPWSGYAPTNKKGAFVCVSVCSPQRSSHLHPVFYRYLCWDQSCSPFTAYVSLIGHVIDSFEVRYHSSYADNTQLYSTLRSTLASNFNSLSDCIAALQYWFWSNNFLNLDKLKAAFFSTKPGLRKPGLPSSICVARCPIVVWERLKILGITLDSLLTTSMR